MADLGRIAAHWRERYRRWSSARHHSIAGASGDPITGDGGQAAALIESLVADAWALGGSWPATDTVAGLASQLEAGAENLSGRVPTRLAGEGPRGSLAAAMGASLAGLRSVAFLSGPDLAASIDLLREAARRRLPLVIHLTERAGGGRSSLKGTSHDAIHLAADSGALLFHAVNVQEVTDLALLARRVAELALLPVVVAMDGAETARSAQDFLLPDSDAIRDYLGGPSDVIDTPAPSQERLFGARRQRVPRWHDAERPLLVAPGQDEEITALAAASRQLLSDRDAGEILAAARSELSQITGRDVAPLRLHGTKGAKMLLIAQGAAVEVLEATSDKLGSDGETAPGIVGLRILRPFPATELVQVLAGRRVAAVLERSHAPAWADPPLLRSIRSVIARAAEPSGEGKGGAATPQLGAKEIPHLTSVLLGAGASALRASDVAALCRRLPQVTDSPIYLGLSFSAPENAYPKQAAEWGAISRAYPSLGSHAIESPPRPLDVRPADAVSVASLEKASVLGPSAPLSLEAGLLLARLAGGHLRSRHDGEDGAARGVSLASITHSVSELRDPGDDAPLDLLMWVEPGEAPWAQVRRAFARLSPDATLLLESNGAQSGGLRTLPSEARRLISERELSVLVSRAPLGGSRESLREHRLGALLGALARRGQRDINPRKLRQARESTLADLDLAESDRESLLAALGAGFESVDEIDLSALLPLPSSAADGPTRTAPELSIGTDRVAKGATPIAGLARFWDQVGVLYEEDDLEHLTPQPALTVPAVPPLSAALPLRAAMPARVPTLEPEICTGCGQCWTVCPEGAVNPLVLPPQDLVEGCMAAAQARGASVEPLRMLAGKLGGGVTKALATAESPAIPLPALLSSSFESVVAKSRLSDERKAAIEGAFAELQATLTGLPIVRTPNLFEIPEKRERGSGEAFALAIDPQACTECALCVTECEPAALRVPDPLTWSPEREEESRQHWALCSALPAPSPETLKRAADNPAFNPLAARMLDRRARQSMRGGTSGEPGAGDKVALRQVVATALTELMPMADQTLDVVRELQSRLASTIHDSLAAALPADDLSALGRGLTMLARPDSDLKELLARVESAVEETPVDVTRLKRIVARATDLADLAWRLEKGEGGWGRQPVGLVLGPGRTSGWAGTFPVNPFSLPVTVDSNGNTAELAAGIASAYEHQTVVLARAMRRAQVELERPAQAAAYEAELRGLTWSALTADERRMCPRLIVVVSESEMASSGLPGLLGLLSSDHRVTVLVFTDLELVDDAARRQTGPWSPSGAVIAADPGLLALSQTEGFLAQTSIAEPDHLADAVISALNFDGAALLRIYTPSPRAHGFLPDQTIERARQAVASRALPLYASRPAAAPGGMRALELDGNPGSGYDWFKGLTPADWALGEARYARLFTRALGDGAELLSSYLRLPVGEREGKTPYLELQEGEEGRLGLTPPLISAIDHASAVWRSLNAWANVERHLEEAERAEVERHANAELKRQHKDELAALAREQQERLSTLGSEIETDLAKRLRARLVELALHPARRPSEGSRS